MSERATNRQRKVLKLLGMQFCEDLTIGAATWEITRLFEDPANEDRWDKYVFLTRDTSGVTDALAPFDPVELENTQLPPDWNRAALTAEQNAEVVKAEMADGSPFDIPMAAIEHRGREFVFTGKFVFGTRKACEAAVQERGSTHAARVSRTTDYLVVGMLGSPTWSNRDYGTKIEEAIILRREIGRPSIVSEQHWRGCL